MENWSYNPHMIRVYQCPDMHGHSQEGILLWIKSIFEYFTILFATSALKTVLYIDRYPYLLPSSNPLGSDRRIWKSPPWTVPALQFVIRWEICLSWLSLSAEVLQFTSWRTCLCSSCYLLKHSPWFLLVSFTQNKICCTMQSPQISGFSQPSMEDHYSTRFFSYSAAFNDHVQFWNSSIQMCVEVPGFTFSGIPMY
jgi:hypothetical protein